MAVIYYIIKKVMEYFLRKRGLKEDTASYVELVKVDKDSNEMIYK
jgi:hypothetical protein